MMLRRFLIFTYSCIAASQASLILTPPPAEDLVDEYYTTTSTITKDFLPQDDKDAQTIVDKDRNEQTIASILCYRDKPRRYAISQKIVTKIDSVVSVSWKGGSSTTYYWVNDRYNPQRTDNATSTVLDFCFGLVEDENIVLDEYLENFFLNRDKTRIIIGMVLTKDMGTMIKMYDDKYGSSSFKHLRKEQKHPFENMLRRWVRRNREPIEEDLNQDFVTADANILKAEQDNGGWHKKRKEIEQILMWKSIKYTREVIREFEKQNGGKTIENIIQDNVQACGLNQGLADAYSTIAIYVKDKYKYIADILRKHSDGSDQWAVWIMCIAVVHPKEWSKIDQVFKDNKYGSLTKFITDKLTSDKTLAEMFAVIIDPNFKPNTFTASSIPNSPGDPPTTLPPVPPTTMVPSV